MSDSESIVSILIKFGLLDAQNADAALQKLQAIDEQQKAGVNTTLKAVDATKELGKEEEKAGEHAEHSHMSHRALHQAIHLIGHIAGPEAGAALAGMWAVAGGGGAMAAIMAVKELVDYLGEAAKKTKELRDEQYKLNETISDGNKAYSDSFHERIKDENEILKVMEAQLEVLKERQRIIDKARGEESGAADLQEQQALLRKQLEDLGNTIRELQAKSKEAENFPVGNNEAMAEEFKKQMDESPGRFISPADIARLQQNVTNAQIGFDTADFDDKQGAMSVLANARAALSTATEQKEDYDAAKINYEAATASAKQMKEASAAIKEALDDALKNQTSTIDKFKAVGRSIVNKAIEENYKAMDPGQLAAAISEGSVSTSGERSSMDAFVQLEQAAGRSNKQIIDIVEKLLNHQADLSTVLAAMDAQIKANSDKAGL